MNWRYAASLMSDFRQTRLLKLAWIPLFSGMTVSGNRRPEVSRGMTVLVQGQEHEMTTMEKPVSKAESGIVGEFVTEARLDALNAALAARGVMA